MKTGITYELIGVVEEHLDFSSDDGEKILGVNVAWLGGSKFMKCDSREQFDKFGPDGTNIRVNGVIRYKQGKPSKFTLGEITQVKEPKTQRTSAAVSG